MFTNQSHNAYKFTMLVINCKQKYISFFTGIQDSPQQIYRGNSIKRVYFVYFMNKTKTLTKKNMFTIPIHSFSKPFILCKVTEMLSGWMASTFALYFS